LLTPVQENTSTVIPAEQSEGRDPKHRAEKFFAISVHGSRLSRFALGRDDGEGGCVDKKQEARRRRRAS